MFEHLQGKRERGQIFIGVMNHVFFFFLTKSTLGMMNGWHLCRVVVWGQRGSADCLLLSWFYMLSMYSRTELNTVGAAGWKQR